MKYSLLKSYLDHNEAVEIRKRLLVIALPAVGENVLQMLLGIADTAFLGHYDWRTIGGVGTANQIIFILQAVLIAISTGTMVFIANSLGANNRRKVDSVAWQAIYLSLVTGIGLAILSVFSSGFINVFFPSAEESLKEIGADYLRIILIGMPGLSFMIIIASALRGAGDTRSPMYAAVVANGLNVFLDYSMIFGKFGFPELGAKGAALATVVSRVVGAMILLFLLYSNRKVGMSRKPVKTSWKNVKEVLSVGLPTAFENFSFSFGVLIFANILLMAGSEAYAAHRIGINVESISFMPAWGISVAITALVGYFNGSGELKKVIGTVRQGWLIGLGFGAIIGSVIFLWPEVFIAFFTSERTIIEMARLPVRLIGLFQIVLATDFVATGALRGLGDTKFPMMASTTAMWLIRIPVGFVLVKYFDMGLLGAWTGMMGDMVFRMVLKVFRLLSGNWEERAKRVREEAAYYD
ncbi:MATE family efflux transporter [Kosmotoga pacifica]|uniref:Multidrug-efflux transporter n=1 Tax=Kosmotoga pacifica TaxID=1330330 RepID=A0A0G2ZD66_9BACT|nr:MATE family efflux transporter [Kosmotoga pacifica]AKI97494.1 multidrug transporter MatE [Kosmotoga pacifica]